MKTTLRFAGREFTVSCNKAVAHTRGDFSGNVDLCLVTQPKLDEAAVVDQLRLSLADGSSQTAVVGTLDGPNGLEMTFHLPSILEMDALPASVALHWAGPPASRLGEVRLRPAD